MNQEVPKIPTRPFGHAGVEVPEIGLGCYNLTSDRGTDRQTALETLQRAYELGVRFFDTAPQYGAGECDELLADAFGHLSDDEVFIGAKLSGPPDDLLNFSYDSCMRSFEGTLKRLRRSSVFALQVHGIRGVRDIEGELREWRLCYEKDMAFGALLKLKEQGVCQTIGATGHNSICIADALKHFPLDSVEIASHYNLISHTAPQTLLPLTQAKEVAAIIANPLGAGQLINIESYKGNMPGAMPLAEAVPLLREMMEETGLALYELALLYLLADDRVTFPIPGPSNVAELEADIGVAWLPRLTAEQVARLDQIGTRKMWVKVADDDGVRLEAVEFRPEWLASVDG